MKVIITGAGLFLLAFTLGWLLQQQTGTEEETAITLNSNCDVSEAACQIDHAGLSYRIYFSGKPSPLKPFKVVLESQRVLSELPLISFEMQGMDMGFNQYPLRAVDRSDTHEYAARVILPVCSLGRNDWSMKVYVKDQQQAVSTQFQFAQQD